MIIVIGLKATIILLMFSLGLGLTRQSLMLLWRDFRLLAGSVAAAFVVVPVVTYLVIQILPLSLGTKAGLWAISITPGAPMIYRSAMHRGVGKPDLAVSFQATAALLVIVLAPTWLAIIDVVTGRDYWIPPTVVLKQVSTVQFIPIIVGMALGHWLPVTAKRFAPILAEIGTIMLIALVVILLGALGMRIIAAISGWMFIAAVLMATAAIIGGHLLSDREPSTRLTIANANAQRNPGLALIIAAFNLPEQKSAAAMAIIVYMLVSVISAAIYTRVYGRPALRQYHESNP